MGMEEAKARMQSSNPSNEPAKSARAVRGNRIPLSVPMRKLEVPRIEGYHTRWFRGTAARLAQAERAGYTYVSADEVELNNVSIGGDARKDGNTDLGSQVSVVEGSEMENGQPVRMVLMKQLLEHHKEDQAILEERNDSIAEALTGSMKTGQVGAGVAGAPAEDAADRNARYVGTRARVPELFRKKTGTRR